MTMTDPLDDVVEEAEIVDKVMYSTSPVNTTDDDEDWMSLDISVGGWRSAKVTSTWFCSLAGICPKYSTEVDDRAESGADIEGSLRRFHATLAMWLSKDGLAMGTVSGVLNPLKTRLSSSMLVVGEANGTVDWPKIADSLS